MATQVSPGIKISEIDNTVSFGQSALTEGGIAGNFQWGPLEQVVTVSTEDELVRAFGKPNNNTANFFFTAANFLAYSASLRVVRIADASKTLAATAAANGSILTSTSTFTVNTSSTTMTAASGNTVALFAGQTLYLANATVNTTVTIASVTNSTAAVLTAAAGAAVTAGNAYAYGVYLKNKDHYEASFVNGEASIGQWAAKYVGGIGNSLRVEVCASANAYYQTPSETLTVAASNTSVTFSGNVATYMQVGDILTANSEKRQVTALASNGTQATINAAFSTALTTASFTRQWQYASLFNTAPGTSTYAAQRGGSLDELHVVVVDKNGVISGSANTVLETFGYVSKASDAKTEAGGGNYYRDVVNRQSAYVWWMDHPSAGANWGSAASAVTFDIIALLQVSSLAGGVDSASVADGDLQRGYDLFKDEQVEVSFLLGANASASLATYLISTIAEPKQFTMAFVSPTANCVVNNPGAEVNSMIAFRNSLPSTSYAVVDSGWKYQYDKYNDVFRYVPLNGDVAGCAVRTDQTSEAWFSPAGQTRGQIKNVVKLAFNPSRTVDRDDLYRNGINPVVTFPGQGTMLYGDKTLLSKPSSFDRINVRRLFIALEKTIKSAATAQLFEQNDDRTRSNFVNLVEPYLRSVKGRRGISDFYVQCDSTNNPAAVVDRGEFRADIYVKPIHSINYIQLNFISVRSDVAFNEVVTTLS